MSRWDETPREVKRDHQAIAKERGEKEFGVFNTEAAAALYLTDAGYTIEMLSEYRGRIALKGFSGLPWRPGAREQVAIDYLVSKCRWECEYVSEALK